MSGFLLRWLVAFAALAAVYNPTEYSFFSWAQDNYEAQKPLTIGIGVMLAIVLLVYLVTFIRTLGIWGILLLAVIFGLLGYILIDNGMLTPELTTGNTWIGLAVLSFVLGAAMSWPSPNKIKKARRNKKTKEATA